MAQRLSTILQWFDLPDSSAKLGDTVLANGITFKRVETALPGVCLIQAKAFPDPRGFFLETYHKAKFAELGVTDDFVQDNHSCSAKGVLRGLHYQLRRPQAKLCQVIEGEVLDVVVDIRIGSPYFGKSVSTVLSAQNHNQIYVPIGCAHGFLVLSDSTHFLYKCSDFYDPAGEGGVAWNDPDLNIAWGIANPLLSEKDRQYKRLAEIPRELLPRYQA